MNIAGVRAVAVRMLRPSTASATLGRASTASMGVRSFSGNVEYPRIEGTVAEVTAQLNTIGARLSIPTAALYLTKQKLEFVVRGMESPDELKEVQRVLLLCDAKYVYPSEFAISSFVSAAVKLQSPDVALDFLRNAQHLRHYIRNQSFVRLASHYASEKVDELEKVDEIARIVDASGVTKSHKWFGFQLALAKKQNDFEKAVAIAKQAAESFQINSHMILTLLEGLEGEQLQAQLPLANYLIAKGDVFVSAKLAEVLKTEP